MRISRNPGSSRDGTALAAGLAAIPLALISAHPAAAAATAPAPTAGVPATPRGPAATVRPPAVPGLTISVGDGRTKVQAGERLTYTVRLRNTGTVSVRRLQITQTLPAGLKIISASGTGVTAAGKVTWHAGLPAGGADNFSVTAQLTRTPAHLLRLAAVACATLQGSSTPAVCAAHLDQLPAGAAAVARARQAATPAAAAGVPVVYVAGLAALAGGALVMIAGRVTRVTRVRRRARRSA